ncbi:MAG: molybdopterin converting factor subunit 1 [Planctomycetaceae bacterium]|nr:molybdopterin converting factor subunit 1 [Planctomycetaceae bacterium]
MLIRVLLFAAARDHAGADSVSVELPAGATVAALHTELSRQLPALTPLLARSAIAVNHDFAEDSLVLSPGDEVAIIPPVSGG